MAFGQDLVDLMGLPLAESRRPTDAYWRRELRTALFDGPGSPAREALGLARQVFQRILDGGETAAQRDRIDGIVFDGVILLRSGRRDWGLRPEEQGNPGIEIEDMNAGLDFGDRAPAALTDIGALSGVEQFKGRAAAAGLLLPERRSPAGNGRLVRGSTTMSRAATMINRRTADSADRNMPSTNR